MSETLCKLYLELANIVPQDCISSREIRLGKIADIYGLALMMIGEGAVEPKDIASKALEKVKSIS
jgi:hypothetical protein